MTSAIVAPRPPQLTVAAVLVAVEGLAAVVFGALEIGQIRTSRVVVGVGVAMLMVGFGLVLFGAARGLIRRRRWSRGPVVALQLILLPVAWSFRAAPTTGAAVLIAVVAVGVLVTVLHPRSTQALITPADAPPAADPGAGPRPTG